jgi:NTP pyrophosphatase (non-canonical NTP hydrolase)
MSDFNDLTRELIAFRDAREWGQYHNSKDLALALSIEASELLELFLWKSAEQVDPERLKEELADVLAYALMLAHNHQLDIGEIIRHKMHLNAQKYPVDKAKGSMRKYTNL